MKLLIYKEKVKYCKKLCSFISKNEEKRRKFFLKTLKTQGEPREVEIENFVSGSTSVCYISKDDTSKKIIYKQFAPRSWF